MAHTPGPWEWKERSHGGYWTLESPSGRVCDDGSAAGEHNQEIDPQGDDAKLIAAAPDLLVACKEIFNCLPHFYDSKRIKPELEQYAGVLSVIGRVALQAIEKAEGK